MRLYIQGYFYHILSSCHFQVEPRFRGAFQNGQISVLNMTTVFPEMDGYSITSGNPAGTANFASLIVVVLFLFLNGLYRQILPFDKCVSLGHHREIRAVVGAAARQNVLIDRLPLLRESGPDQFG